MGYKLALKVTGRDGGIQIFLSQNKDGNTSGFHEMQGISKLADKSLASLKKGSVPWS
jgi:hypothetical protein